MDTTNRPGAQRLPAIIQGDLRNRPKDVLANGLERDDLGEQHGRDARAQDVGNPTFRCDKAEYAIGGRD